jgi:subtilase family serine protease
MSAMVAVFQRMAFRTSISLALLSTTLTASAAQMRPRIASEVSNSEMAVVKNSEHPLANPAFDAGRMPGNTQLQGITIYFNRSAAQQSDLNVLLAAQQDPSSPQFHQWLAPDQFAARFGMAQADLDKVSTWLQQQGFTVDSVSRSRNAIRFSGTAAQVEAAFRTEMHYYSTDGQRHFAPSGPVSVPAAIAPTVLSVGNLASFQPHPTKVQPRPDFTSAQSGNTFFGPGDIATAYDTKPLTSGGSNGAGQSIAIMGQSSVVLGDIEAFQTASGLTKNDPELVLMPGSGNSQVFTGDESESDLDLEWSGAIAPGAHIVFVYTGSNANFGVFDAVQYAVDEKIAPIISISYAACETELSASQLTTLESMFQQAASQGQTVMSASGDQGSTACSGFTNLTQAQQTAITVNYPASSAYVTGVGGTEISSANAASSTYWQTASGSDVVNSLKQYVPEIVWNDSSSQFGLSASGGGTSALVARPSWQTGVPGIPSGAMRLVPDVAFYSSPSFVGYLYCTSDQTAWASTQQSSCTNGFRDTTSGLLTVAGGTSFASPIFAGMVAILNQKLNYTQGQGLINPTLYSLASNSTTYASAFHDVTQGNNNCTAGTTFCGSTTGGFSANAGYDEVTGLGSVDLANLAGAWPANSGGSASLISTATGVSASTGTPQPNANVTFTITVTSQTGTSVPSGNVTLQIDGGPTFGGTTVANQALGAQGTVSYTTTFATSGPHQVLAQYAGDSTHASSVGTSTVTVPGASGTKAIALAATNVSVSQGSSGNSTVTVTPSGGYTGTVLISLSTTSTELQNLCFSFTAMDSQGNGTVAVSGMTAVTTTLSLDTKASDCVSSAAAGAGLHSLRRIGVAGAKSANNHEPAGSRRAPMGLAFAGLLLAGFLARGSRKLRALACVIALAVIGFGVTACSTTNVAPNPSKGTYTIQVSGQDSANAAITAQTSMTLTIN